VLVAAESPEEAVDVFLRREDAEACSRAVFATSRGGFLRASWRSSSTDATCRTVSRLDRRRLHPIGAKERCARSLAAADWNSMRSLEPAWVTNISGLRACAPTSAKNRLSRNVETLSGRPGNDFVCALPRLLWWG
jgi:hypothetical protein